MLFILYLFVHITAQSDCTPKYTNLYPKKQQIANLNISDVISGFNYSLINPPNGINLLQSGQLIFGETIKENIQQVLFADINLFDEYPLMEQIASLIQINNTSYQVLVVNKYYNQTHSSQLYGAFNSDYQCLSIRQMNSDFMIINCLQNQIVTIYQGNVQTSILPNITSNNYPSQIQLQRIDYQLFVIFPINLNVSFVFQINISSTNTVEYKLINSTAYPGIVYNTIVNFANQFILTSEQFFVIYLNQNYYTISIPINDCFYFNINQDHSYYILQIMILCQNNIQEYQLHSNQIDIYQDGLSFFQYIPYPFTSNYSLTQNYIPLQLNREYMILQQEKNYIIYDLVKNKINFNSINYQPLFILINPYSTTYFTLSTNTLQIFSLQNPLLVINQLKQQLSNITIQISLYITLNISCYISLNIIPSTNNGIYLKNSSKLFPQKITQSIPIFREMNEYFIGSNISFSIQNSQNILKFYSLDLYLINKTNSNLQYNQILDSDVIFIQNAQQDLPYFLLFLQYKNLTFHAYKCKLSPYYDILCSFYYFYENFYTEIVQTLSLMNQQGFCVGFSIKIQCNFLGANENNLTVDNKIIQMQFIGQLLFVMQEYIISVFNPISGQNTSIYNITNITPTQIIANYDLYGPLLFINNQTQLLIYFCSPSKAYLIKSISIQILNPTIIFAQEYIYISNSSVQETYYIYYDHTIQLINSEFGSLYGQYYFNPYFKFFVQFSSDYILSIFENSGQNNQLFKQIQLNSSIEQVSLTNFNKLIVINFLQQQQVVTYLIDQYQTLILIPEILNYDYITVNYSINASNQFGFSILNNQLIILNSGVFIFEDQQNSKQLYLTNDNQSFSIDPSFMKGQISNYQFNCFECETYKVTQQYQLINFINLNAMTYIQNMNYLAYTAGNTLYLFNPINQETVIFVTFPSSSQEFYWMYYISNLNIIIQLSYKFYVIVFTNSTYSYYILQLPILNNIQVVDQFNAVFFQQNNMYEICFYQITLTEPILEWPILSQSQILSYSAGGTNNTDNNYMVLMYLTEDQYLFINLYSVNLTNNYYNYSLLNTTSISISKLMQNHTFAGSDAYQIQIIQIIMNNQYIFSMQTVITTQYFYSYLVNINILIGSSDQITTQLKCLIPPYGNWGKLNQINGNNQTLILIYRKSRQEQQNLIALYDLNQCQNQITLNFSVGIPTKQYGNFVYFPMLLYSIQPNADLFQSTLVIESDLQGFFYNFSENIVISIQQQSKGMDHNQSVYLIASNHFMQSNMTLYLIEGMQIMTWLAWLLISLAIVLVLGVTCYLIIRSKRQKREEAILEIK